ncbi:MAG: hypothetical protein ACOC1I_05020, partial [Spirochaetota bacterium]
LWSQNWYQLETLNYSETLLAATEPTGNPDSLGARTVTSVSLPGWLPGTGVAGADELVFEPEIALETGDLTSRIALGVGLVNYLGSRSYEQTTTTYAGGADATAQDTVTVNRNTGSYFWDAGGGLTESFAMNTNTLAANDYAPHVELNLYADNRLTGVMDGTLELPVTVMYNLYPGSLQTVDTTIVSNYDDSIAPSRLTDVTTTTVTTTASSILDLYVDAGARYRRTFEAGDGVLVHLGAGLILSGAFDSIAKSQEETVRDQTDGSNDGLFTDPTLDTDVTTREYGYSISVSEQDYGATIDLPVSVSYQPIPLFTFQGGVTTTVDVGYLTSTSTTRGAAAYTTRDVTDNLTPANSTTGTDIPNHNNPTTTVGTSAWDFNFSTTSDFGVTMNLSEQLKIDALGTGFGGAGLDAFTLTAIWSY